MPPKTSQKVSATKAKRAAKNSCSSSSTVTNLRGSNGTVPVTPTVSTRITSLLGAPLVNDFRDAVVEPVSTTCSNQMNPCERLSTVVHGVFLVTMVKMAQLRVSHTERSITTVMDDRWLGALVRYCGFTVALSDIIECGAAFADWLKVTVTVNSNSVPQQSERGIVQERETRPATTTVSPTAPMVKVKLLRESVPSASESAAFLRERWGNSEDWRSNVSLPLYGAVHPTVAGDTAMRGAVPDGVLPMETTTFTMNKRGGDDVADGEELLAQLSTELRASLSKEKLHSVLEQMRRESLGLDAKEQEEICKRQRMERLLSTYDLVRSVLGETRSLCNMGVLIKQMMAQNPFEDAMERLLQQLASLVKYTESGFTVYALDEEQSQEEKERGKGKEVDGETTLLRMRDVDLAHCTLHDLESVLFRLDRHRASRAKLHLALQRE